jgi:hypothetical protein
LGNGKKRFYAILLMAILLFSGLASSLAYAQSYSSSSNSSSTACCCCCLPVALILVVLWLNNRSKSRTGPGPADAQTTVLPQQPAYHQPVQQQPLQIVYKEKETIREIVKVRCEYCGTLVDITSSRCPSCGAPFKGR